MSENRLRRVLELFQIVLDRPEGERDRAVDELCGDDPVLVREVRALLDENHSSGILDHPDRLGEPGADPDALVGSSIGPYRLEKHIGAGGMGAVYAAVQDVPIRRRVALKIIKPGMDSAEIVARFDSERRALALMDHPNIATVLDAGATDEGRSYFVMELVDGVPVTDFCDRVRMSIHDRLELFNSVCRAVQHAHQKGIIHRDLKPTNILVASHDGLPLAKVIDFGVAKAVDPRLTGASGLTTVDHLIGTPEYMSPEQATSGRDVDTRSDIYSLGVTLYEIACGRPPFDFREPRRLGSDRLCEAIRSDEAPPLSSSVARRSDAAAGIATARSTDTSSLRRLLRSDLEWIVRRAMAKDREERYQTAAEMADDIERYLGDRPVHAGPPSRTRQLHKFVRRHRAAVFAGSMIVLGLVVGAIGLAAGLVNARQAAAAAEIEREKAEQVNVFLQQMLASVSPYVAQGRDTGLFEDLLEDAADRIDHELSDQPVVAAYLHATLAGAYEDLGEYDTAEDHDRSAWRLLRKAVGDDDPRTMQALSDIALSLAYRNRLEESESINRQVLERQLRVQGPEHEDTLTTMNNLALALKAAGEYDEARSLYEIVVETRSRTLGPEHRRTLITMSNLAMLARVMGDLDRSVVLMREVVALEREHHRDDPEGLISINQLAMVLREVGELEGAERHHREALAGMERIFGPEHPDTLTTKQTLAGVLILRDELDEAESLLLEALEGARKTVGESDPRVVFTLMKLARCLHRQGRLEDSENRYLEAIEIAEQAFPPRHPRQAALASDYGDLLIDRRRFEDAEKQLNTACELFEAALGRDHSATRQSFDRRARLYEMWGRPGGADAVAEATSD